MKPRGSERQGVASVAEGWERRKGDRASYREDVERTQLAVCASDVRQGKSEQQGRARVAPSRERLHPRRSAREPKSGDRSKSRAVEH